MATGDDQSYSAQEGLAALENDTFCFICSLDGQQGLLSIDAESVQWRAQRSVPIQFLCEDVVAVSFADHLQTKLKRNSSFRLHPTPPSSSRHPGLSQNVLILSVIQQQPSAKWRVEEHRVTFPSATECWDCCQRIQCQLADFDRPKNLLVFVDAFDGSKKARQVYDRDVAPVFSLASIRTNVMAKRRRHVVREFLEDKLNDLSCYDGIVVVGGDAMLSEVLHGLLVRANGAIQPDQELRETELPFAQIPLGSDSSLSFETTGTSDAVTSALHVVVGDRMSIDAASLFRGTELKGFAATMLTYGFFTDVLAESERFRWLGSARLRLSSARTMLNPRKYRGTITICPAGAGSGDPFDGTICTSDCSVCSKPVWLDGPPEHVAAQLQKASFEQLTGGAIKLKGSFLSIVGAMMSGRMPSSPVGASPYNHVRSGTMDLIIARPTSSKAFRQHLNQDGIRSLQHPFIQSFRVRQFTFEPEKGSQISSWCSDGEPLLTSTITARVHQGAIRVFGRGFLGNKISV